MKRWKKAIKRWAKRHPAIVPAIAFAVFVHALDVYSTHLGAMNGALEANQFARHADYTPWLSHLIAVKLIAFIEYGLIAAVVWHGVQRLNRNLAEALVVVLIIYFSFSSLDAAISNLMTLWGWYVPNPPGF